MAKIEATQEPGVASLHFLPRTCDQCGKAIEGGAVIRYFRTFCCKLHVADYFGAYIDDEEADFPTVG